jgi:hypothetical protein
MPSNSRLALAALAATVATLAATGARAETPISIEGHIGTAGVGLQAQAKINDYIGVHVGGDWFGFRHAITSENVRYAGDVLWATGSVGIDIHPLKNGFYLGGGGYFGTRKFGLDADPSRSFTYNGVTLTPDQIGHLHGEAKLEASAPYVGIGWDTLHTSHGGFGWKVLAGAVFSPDAKVTLNLTGPAGNTANVLPAVQAYLDAQAGGVRHKLGFMNAYPLIQIGAGWRF